MATNFRLDLRHADTSASLENKIVVPTDRSLQLAVGGREGGQEELEANFEELYKGVEIVEQSALDHFNAILQKAQCLAAQAAKNNS